MSVLEVFRQRTRLTHVIVSASIGLFVLTGLAISGSLDESKESVPYWEARLAYGALTLFAIVMILQQIRQLGWRGLLTPLSMTMFGFYYFFFMFPLINPDILPMIYGDRGRFMPIASLVGVGMLSFVGGYVVSPLPRWAPLETLVNHSLNDTRLVRSGLALGAAFGALWLLISAYGHFSPLYLVLQSRYAMNDQFGVSEFEGLNYYLWQILFFLPVALAPLVTFILVGVRLNVWARLIFIGILGMSVLLVFGSGVRFILTYALGGIVCTLALWSKGTSKSRRSRALLAVLAATAIMVMTAIQLQTRSSIGLYDLLAGGSEFSVSDSLSGSVRDIASDQNYTLDGVVGALNAGTLKPLWGESYIMTFVLLVPRSIWPSKPGSGIAPALRAANPFYGDNVSYSAIGELAFNFTLWGVPVGMFISGLLAGAWWKWYRQHQTSGQAVILYSMSVLPFAFIIRGSFNTMCAAVIYPMLLVLLALAFSSSGQERAASASVQTSTPNKKGQL